MPSMRRKLIGFSLVLVLGLPAIRLSLDAQTPQGATTSALQVPRAIRRDVPMTNAIRRAFAAGTRDLTGRPGPNYWQLQTDYTIKASLDPATQTITGSETIALHNNSPEPLPQIRLRLDHNIFRERTPFAAPWRPSELTDGMVVTKLVVNGESVNIAAATGGAGRRGGGGGATGQSSASGMDTTLALISLANAIPAKATATLEIEW